MSRLPPEWPQPPEDSRRREAKDPKTQSTADSIPDRASDDDSACQDAPAERKRDEGSVAGAGH